jgi:hypothetical protein
METEDEFDEFWEKDYYVLYDNTGLLYKSGLKNLKTDKELKYFLKQSKLQYNKQSYIYLLPHYAPQGFITRYILLAFCISERKYFSIKGLTIFIKDQKWLLRSLVADAYKLKQSKRKKLTGKRDKKSDESCYLTLRSKNVSRSAVRTNVHKLNPVFLDVRQKGYSEVVVSLNKRGKRLKELFLEEDLLF